MPRYLLLLLLLLGTTGCYTKQEHLIDTSDKLTRDEFNEQMKQVDAEITYRPLGEQSRTELGYGFSVHQDHAEWVAGRRMDTLRRIDLTEIESVRVQRRYVGEGLAYGGLLGIPLGLLAESANNKRLACCDRGSFFIVVMVVSGIIGTIAGVATETNDLYRFK
jgi:hypothetical protein